MTPAHAADAVAPAADATAPADSGDILVTARKREENVLKTPITVNVLSSADIAKRGIVSITDIATFTPGLNVNANSSGRNDRSFQQIILRGFTPSSQTATPTTSLFIDGVPVASATALDTIDDPERVEILKGPQSAYFGRNTFAGAVNVITKLPSDHFSGAISGQIDTRASYDVHGDVEGPIISDKLSFRASIRKFSKTGSYTNAFDPGQTLGDQSTTSGTLLLVAKPIDGLTIKGLGLLSVDHDGPPAQGIISAYTVKDANGNVVVPSQSNCTLAGRTSGIQGLGAAVANPYICGTAPGLSAGSPSANTLNDSFITNFLANPKGRLVSPSDGVHGYGLRRRYYHLHLGVDYQVGDTGVTLSSLTGLNRERFSELADLDNVGTTAIANNGFGPPAAGARSYYDFPFLVERTNHDFSQEFRANYDNHGRLRVTIGASYLNNRVQGGLGGGNGALGITTFSAVSGATRSKTIGGFFSISYDVTSKLTVNFDGRYQQDELFAYAQPGGVTLPTDVFAPAGFYPAGSNLIPPKKYRNFLPRAIAQYQATPDLMVYASYSKGVNPGQFNTQFLTQTPSAQQAAANTGIGIGVKPEKLTNYEIGLKGKFFDGRLRLSAAAYYAKWTDQINTISTTALDDNNVAQIVSGSANTGKLDLKGIEFDATATPVDHISLNAAAALNDTDIKQFVSPALSQLTGIFDFRGKQNPNTSKYSATAGAQYTNDLPGFKDGSWFARADFVYKSGTYSNQANIVKTPDTKLVNLRSGVDFGRFSVEAFLNNVFNQKAYTTIADNFIFTNNFRFNAYNSALIVGLPDLRTFGVKAKFKF